ncbi:transglycosylase domain-containing protein [Streptomyces lunaelactis]|uniref:transglycosylase domain-containing protein n=1 Tax=Streptomyces lunaelactis TaxID=1535768 RepID=UPI001585D15E|nr:transglycosylase domain-containing protein [Streptomyces lunaelactis]NUK01282.1 penicillin-binding protein [Streptomyces lunaelactis]NUK15254.1 penicillin-binding protein [Streptomyces lunaelactis]
MSEHRRKPPQPPQPPQGGGRAGARRAAQQPSGRRAAPSRGTTSGSPSVSSGEQRPYGGRAEARRAAQRNGGGRGRVDEGAGAGHGGRGGGRRGGGGGGHDGPGRGRGGRPSKKRIIDYPRHNKYGWRRWVPSWKLVTGLCLGFIGSLMAAATIAYAMVEVPDQDKTAKAQNNVYYWADGKPMAATGGEINRQIIPIEKIPANMQNAVISAENKTFKDDSGIDPMGISRALLNMAKGGQTQGGSTITQQYVKNAMLGDQSQTLTRKFKELFISIRVGTDLDKPEIMAGYLNTSYYGRGAYGIQAAARTYYGKNADTLDAGECAFLASLLKGATYFDPAGAEDIDPAATAKANTERAIERRNWILDEMVKDGHLPAGERAKVAEFKMPDKPKKDAQLGGQVGYLVDLAKSNFLNSNPDMDATDLARGGYEIHTTFEKDKVDKLKAAVKKVQDANIKPEKRPKTDTFVQFGGASVNPKTGAIAAVYGGEDATKHFTNNANETGAQVGSTFKPFVLAAAMRDGVRDPELGEDQDSSERTIVDPDKTIYNGKNKLKIKKYDGSIWTNEEGKEWLQTNDGDESYKNINLREAMVHSANSPFVQLGMDIGIPEVRKAATDAGLLESSLSKSNVPSFSIGISSPSAIRMAGAYATFAANGEQRDPFSVTRVEYQGRTVYKHEDHAEQPFTSAVASNVTDVLRSVVDEPEGTGKNARLPDREVAGKTGTTDGNKSAWFVGYTPQLSTAIDMYRLDDNEKSKKREFLEMYGTGGQDKIHGASFPSEIWQAYMKEALKNTSPESFPDPEPIGEAYWGGGASSPPPTPSNTPSGTPSSTPSNTPSGTPSGSPDPSTSCDPWQDWTCDPTGGANGSNGNGGTTSGPSGTPSISPSTTATGTNGNGGGNGNGGFIGGSG